MPSGTIVAIAPAIGSGRASTLSRRERIPTAVLAHAVNCLKMRPPTVTFEFDSEHQGTTYHMVFSGAVGDDGGIKGSIAVAGVEGTFTAKKQ